MQFNYVLASIVFKRISVFARVDRTLAPYYLLLIVSWYWVQNKVVAMQSLITPSSFQHALLYRLKQVDYVAGCMPACRKTCMYLYIYIIVYCSTGSIYTYLVSCQLQMIIAIVYMVDYCSFENLLYMLVLLYTGEE